MENTVMSESDLRWYEKPDELRRVREQLGVTQTELAERAKVKQSLVSAIENGKRPISNRSGEKLWRALGEISYEKKNGVNALRSALQTPGTRTLPGALDMLKSLGLDKTPEQLLKDENRILKDRISNYEAQIETANALNETLKAQLKSYEDLCKLQDRRDTWYQPMSDRIISLESKVAELRSLVGLETTAVVSRSEADELKEKIKESEQGKDGL
jgi:transcriptional regulator with XRE-family HTH domain